MPKALRTYIHQLGQRALQVHPNSGPPDKPRGSFSVGNNLSQYLWVDCSQLTAQTTLPLSWWALSLLPLHYEPSYCSGLPLGSSQLRNECR